MAKRPLLFTEDMATISFSPEAPSEKVHFAFGQSEFDLSPGSTYESDSPSVLAGAEAHPWLTVTKDVTAQEAAMDPANSTDPHVNPRADHLSELADPSVVAAAVERAEAIRAMMRGEVVESVPEPEATTEAAPAKPVIVPAEGATV